MIKSNLFINFKYSLNKIFFFNFKYFLFKFYLLMIEIVLIENIKNLKYNFDMQNQG